MYVFLFLGQMWLKERALFKHAFMSNYCKMNFSENNRAALVSTHSSELLGVLHVLCLNCHQCLFKVVNFYYGRKNFPRLQEKLLGLCASYWELNQGERQADLLMVFL